MFPAENTVQKIYPVRQRIGSNHLIFSTISSFTQFSVSEMSESFNKPSYGTKYSVTCFIIIIYFFSIYFFIFLLLSNNDSTPA